MCIIAIAYNVHPDYPLVIAANRDEFYDRPTAPLAFWPDNPDILAGRDLKHGGTWLGVNRSGEIAAVTNYREPEAGVINSISRGALVSDYLAGDMPPERYLRQIADRKDQYSGFNLVAGNKDALYWYSNRGSRIMRISPGIHAISNHLLDTPWPKVEKIRHQVTETMDADTITPEDFFALLADQSRPPIEMLPNTGVGRQWEKVLSPVFITSDIYGTRSSSVIIVDLSGKMVFCERTFNGSEKPPADRCFQFSIPSRASTPIS
jgi:uncharacterized protein with NRDE domain